MNAISLSASIGRWLNGGVETRTVAMLLSAGGARAKLRPAPRPRASNGDSGFDTTRQSEKLADEPLDEMQIEMLRLLRSGLVDPSQPKLLAGYGSGAALAIDFDTGMVRIDEDAERRLRVQRELPTIGLGTQLGANVRDRELDRVAWDIAMAAGSSRLLGAPDHWWKTMVVATVELNVARYTAQPLFLSMARTLASEPMTPAQLRRHSRVSMPDLRAFLQACLFLGLVQWVESESTDE